MNRSAFLHRECEAPAEQETQSTTHERRTTITVTVMATFGWSRRPTQVTCCRIIIFLCALCVLGGSIFFVLSLEEDTE
jgi:hypothetical protein